MDETLSSVLLELALHLLYNMNFKFTICLAIICLIIVNGEEFKKRVKRIVGGSPAELPPEDDPLIFLQFAGKSASIRGVREFPHYVFRGIRYAQPPTGRDRFQVKYYFISATFANKILIIETTAISFKRRLQCYQIRSTMRSNNS